MTALGRPRLLALRGRIGAPNVKIDFFYGLRVAINREQHTQRRLRVQVDRYPLVTVALPLGHMSIVRPSGAPETPSAVPATTYRSQGQPVTCS